MGFALSWGAVLTPINICGPSYQFTDVYAAVEDTVNWILVPNESPDETAFKMVLEQSPCNAPFGQLPVPSPLNGPGLGLLQYQDILYGVNLGSDGNCHLWSMDASGNYTNIADLNPWTENGPVSMVGNGTGQIFMAHGASNTAWVHNVTTNVTMSLPPISGFQGGNVSTFQDGYIITLSTGTRQFQISGFGTGTPLGDATQWSGQGVNVLAGQADYVSTLISSHEYLRIFGLFRSQIFYNAGAVGIGGYPFQSYNETFIETGCSAPFSLSDMGDSLIWIGQDARGQTAAWRDFGFQPQRVSTFAIEQQWQAYGYTDDAIAFSWKWKGHLLWQVSFPSAGYTWVYDATASQIIGKACWHRRNFNNGSSFLQRPEKYHAYCYGLHLVLSDGGDGNPGAVYQYADTYADCANVSGEQTTMPAVPVRTIPRLFQNRDWLRIPRLRVACQQGVGNSTWPNPQLLLRISRDGGNTYGDPISAPLGAAGAYDQMTEYHGLGAARNWVLSFYGDGAAVPHNIQGAWADIGANST